ncbi:MAG: type II toxin-antitoxin system MqsA family antitoxin [Anaerosomatales bacterium]|nr:type II toxin-antitoxin system MqsA family antitoxin [Anaerosomatales bacterium]
MYPKKCAECGGEVRLSTDPISVDVRGQSISVAGIEHGRCTVCGEEYLTLEASEELQKEAVRRSKAARGLLSPEEIRELRRSLGLSQAAFEKILGVGPKTVVRWEKGTVFQNATADRLMRLIAAEPWIVGLLQSDALYSRPSTEAPAGVTDRLSGQWKAVPIHRNHLRLVTNHDNAAAA